MKVKEEEKWRHGHGKEKGWFCVWCVWLGYVIIYHTFT